MYNNDLDTEFATSMKWIVLFISFCALASGLGWCAHAAFYPVDQAQRVMENTLNADNVIYNYEWFHQHNADYEAAGANVTAKQQELDQFLASAGPRETWSYASQRENNQLRVELSGLRAHRTNIAHEYNAHVGMANRNLFRERSLPVHLSDQ